MFGIRDNGRTAGMLSYFFVIGWTLGYIGFHRNNKQHLSAFHLRQTLLLYHVFGMSYFIVHAFIRRAEFHLDATRLDVLKICVIVVFAMMWAIGLRGARNEEHMPIPIIGTLAQRIFWFI